MWHFTNGERSFLHERFKHKLTFDTRTKDTIIQTYLSCVEDNLLDIEIPSRRFNTPSKNEGNSMYNLTNHKTIIINSTDKVAMVILWDREDFLKEASKKLGDKEVYLEILNNPSALFSTSLKKKKRKRGDLYEDAFFARFYLLSRIHKRLFDVLDFLICFSHRKFFLLFIISMTYKVLQNLKAL